MKKSLRKQEIFHENCFEDFQCGHCDRQKKPSNFCIDWEAAKNENSRKSFKWKWERES